MASPREQLRTKGQTDERTNGQWLRFMASTPAFKYFNFQTIKQTTKNVLLLSLALTII